MPSAVPTACRLLLATDTDPHADTLEAAADRELLSGLAGSGVPGRAVGRGARAVDRQGQLVEALDADQPDVLLVRPGPSAAANMTAARDRRVAVAVLQADAAPKELDPLRAADLVLAPTAFTAVHLRDAYGLPAVWLPPVAAGTPLPGPQPGAVVFDGTVPGGGLPVFAQLAEELARARPDVPFVILGGTGEVQLAGGRTVRGVSRFTASTLWPDARVLLAPAVGWEAAPAAVPAALAHGVPVLASDCGPLPELLGDGGRCLQLPDRLTPAHAARLTAAELAPWVEAVLRLFDDPAAAAAARTAAAAAARRYSADTQAPRYAEVLTALAARRRFPSANGFHGPTPTAPARGKWTALVPHLNGIEWECEQALRQLEAAGVRVVRRGGCSAVDVARNELLSDALHDGAERMLFIDADIGFDPADALRLFARPEPAVSAVYPKKGPRELASTFADGVTEVQFGPDAPGAYPLKYAATGFLRVTADLLRRLIADLHLPLCNTHWGRGVWPFFQPMIVPHGDGKFHYLGEDWAFSRRLADAGVVPLADTTVRLWHWGRYGFGWEDAGRSVDRYRSYSYRLTGS